MKINEVESLVGITKKNIRFYEQENLLSPGRNKENGYRDYSEADVNILKTIKILRMMGISIEEIRDLLNEKKDFQVVLEHQILRLTEQQKAIGKMKELCNNMIDSRFTWNHENLTTYLAQMNLMEKEGQTMVDVKKKDQRQKSVAAVVAALVMMVLMGVVIGLIIWANGAEPGMPVGLLVFLVGIPTAVIVGIVMALTLRMKEIKGGEEYEASKY
ncbi:MAG: MerR family transcriptional regulator [Lachnospiraceae bacterium]